MCNCCILTIRHRGGGDWRRSREECHTCCSGSSRDAIDYQLFKRLISSTSEMGAAVKNGTSRRKWCACRYQVSAVHADLLLLSHIPSSKALPSSRIYIRRRRTFQVSIIARASDSHGMKGSRFHVRMHEPLRSPCKERHRHCPWDCRSSHPRLPSWQQSEAHPANQPEATDVSSRVIGESSTSTAESLRPRQAKRDKAAKDVGRFEGCGLSAVEGPNGVFAATAGATTARATSGKSEKKDERTGEITKLSMMQGCDAAESRG